MGNLKAQLVPGRGEKPAAGLIDEAGLGGSLPRIKETMPIPVIETPVRNLSTANRTKELAKALAKPNTVVRTYETRMVFLLPNLQTTTWEHLSADFCLTVLGGASTSRTHTFLEVLLVGEVAKDHGAEHHPQEEEHAQGFRLASTVTNQVPLKNR